MSAYSDGPVPGPPDVVIHFAGKSHCVGILNTYWLVLVAYARNMLVPDSELFQANVRSTYNVVEAACKLGVKKIIIASSETTYGVCFAQGDADYHSFPLEEDYDVDPEDSYDSLTNHMTQLSKTILGMHSPRSAARRQHEPSPDVSKTTFTLLESETSSSRMNMRETSPPISPTLLLERGMRGVISMLVTWVRSVIWRLRRVVWDSRCSMLRTIQLRSREWQLRSSWQRSVRIRRLRGRWESMRHRWATGRSERCWDIKIFMIGGTTSNLGYCWALSFDLPIFSS